MIQGPAYDPKDMGFREWAVNMALQEGLTAFCKRYTAEVLTPPEKLTPQKVKYWGSVFFGVDSFDVKANRLKKANEARRAEIDSIEVDNQLMEKLDGRLLRAIRSQMVAELARWDRPYTSVRIGKGGEEIEDEKTHMPPAVMRQITGVIRDLRIEIQEMDPTIRVAHDDPELREDEDLTDEESRLYREFHENREAFERYQATMKPEEVQVESDPPQES